MADQQSHEIPSEKKPVETAAAAERNTSMDEITAVAEEHNQSFWYNIRQHPHAVAWSVLLSTAVIMEGFDIVLINTLFAVDAFKQTFGRQLPDGSYELTAAWQAGLSNGAIVGEILGLLLNGLIADRYGFKKTMIGALMAITGLIFIPFFSTSPVQLLVGLILMGIPWGVFQTLTTTYAADICPTGLRPYLTTYVNLCWVIGQFLASGVLVGTQDRTDHWAYRIPYALQWIWPVPLIIGVIFAPESPWWLVRKDRFDDAHKVLKRLAKADVPPSSLDATLAMIKKTNDFEKSINDGTSYWDCFKGVDLRRTEIVCMVWLIQAVAGGTFLGFSTYFFQSAGLDDNAAFGLTLGQYAIGAVGTVLSWTLMGYFGRRTLHLSGVAILLTIYAIVGFCGIAPQSDTASRWAIGSMLLICTFAYDCTIGPVTYCLVAEMPSTRLRQKSVVLARTAYNIGTIICNVLITRQINASAWGWGAKAGFFWAGAGAVSFVWVFFRLPEPKGRTYGELDALFERRTSARKFASVPAEDLLDGYEDGTVNMEKRVIPDSQHLEHENA